ncbi:MAG TPA: glycosyltransferase family 39 protein, partial [Acidimicrobiales bacterium]|nr:glycosyltransferase family 39 protein [Acidimicrobiales bacterium]
MTTTDDATRVGDGPAVDVPAGGEAAVAERPAGDGPAPRDGSRRGPLRSDQRRWLHAIVVVGAVLRLVWLVCNHVEPPESMLGSGDQYSYWYYGNAIADGEGYISYATGEATAYYPIGYPAILAGLIWTAERVSSDVDLMLVIGAFHVVVSAATVPLTFVVGRRLLGTTAGLVAAALMALFPNQIYQVTSLQLEATFTFLVMASLAIVVDHDWSTGPPSRRRLAAFGAVLAVSMLVRPFSGPMLVALPLALLVAGVGWRRALALFAVPALVVVAAFVPWTIRNARAFGDFIPSSTNMGDTLCIDRSLDATGGFRWAMHDGCVDPNLPEHSRNRGNTTKAIEFVMEHPDRELLQIVRRAKLIFGEDNDGIQAVETMGSGKIFSPGTRRFFVETADWYFHVVLVAAVLGLRRVLRDTPRAERLLVVVPFGALIAIPLLLWGNPRFHLPYVPFLALCAAATATAVHARLAGRRSAAAAVGADAGSHDEQ